MISIYILYYIILYTSSIISKDIKSEERINFRTKMSFFVSFLSIIHIQLQSLGCGHSVFCLVFFFLVNVKAKKKQKENDRFKGRY